MGIGYTINANVWE